MSNPIYNNTYEQPSLADGDILKKNLPYNSDVRLEDGNNEIVIKVDVVYDQLDAAFELVQVVHDD